MSESGAQVTRAISPSPNPLAWALLDQLGRPAALSDATGQLVAMNAAFRRQTHLEEKANLLPIRLVGGRLRDAAGHLLTPSQGVVTTGLPPGEGVPPNAETQWRLVELAHRSVSLPELARRFRTLSGGAALLQLEPRAQPGLLHQLGLDRLEAILDALEERLLESLPAGSSLCRSRTERLIALVPWQRNLPELHQQALRWQALLSAPLWIDQHRLEPVLSVGVSRSPDDGQGFELLLESSSQALARAHRQPTASVCVAAPPPPAQRQVRRLAHPLAEAIDQGKLRLLYQPIVAMAEGRIEGVEVLCRWEDPVLGAISPTEFIAVAEATEQIHLLGSWLIDRVFAQLRRWQGLPAGIQYASLNVSPLQLHHPALVQSLRTGLARHGLQAGQVMLEITEDQFIDPGSGARERFLELHQLGFCLAMDDYGTGYSGLQRLNSLPFSAVKVDRCLIEAIETDRLQQAMLQGAVDLQTIAGMRVVVEGVERPSQRRRLLELGCRLGQGFLFSRPVPAEEMERLLNLPVLPAQRA
jgi:EAL domain-containing protein (putative c-di-GMP-specific phosphodiesterase class I)